MALALEPGVDVRHQKMVFDDFWLFVHLFEDSNNRDLVVLVQRFFVLDFMLPQDSSLVLDVSILEPLLQVEPWWSVSWPISASPSGGPHKLAASCWWADLAPARSCRDQQICCWKKMVPSWWRQPGEMAMVSSFFWSHVPVNFEVHFIFGKLGNFLLVQFPWIPIFRILIKQSNSSTFLCTLQVFKATSFCLCKLGAFGRQESGSHRVTRWRPGETGEVLVGDGRGDNLDQLNGPSALLVKSSNGKKKKKGTTTERTLYFASCWRRKPRKNLVHILKCPVQHVSGEGWKKWGSHMLPSGSEACTDPAAKRSYSGAGKSETVVSKAMGSCVLEFDQLLVKMKSAVWCCLYLFVDLYFLWILKLWAVS